MFSDLTYMSTQSLQMKNDCNGLPKECQEVLISMGHS